MKKRGLLCFLAVLIALMVAFTSKAIAPPAPVSLVAPLVTVRPTLAANQAGYYYTSRHEPVAYVADAATPIRFSPINFELLPTLVLEVPAGIEILSGIRELTIHPPQPFFRDGQRYQRYRISPNSSNASKFTFFWRSTLPVGAKREIYYHALWSDGAQNEQTLAVNVIALPQGRVFEQIPVWYSIPSDMANVWADAWTSPADYRRGGFNTLDIWTYLSPEDRRWGEPLVEQVAEQYRLAGVNVWAWPGEWWWRKAAQSEQGQAVAINGDPSTELNLLYRGAHFTDWLEAGKALIDRGLYTHVVDPEIYRQVDQAVGYSSAAKADFQQYLGDHKITLTESDPSIFMRQPERYPAAVSVWRKWRAAKYTDFFVDYRTAMRAYMDSLGIREPLTFAIYATYHSQWDAFYGFEDYETAPPYVHTLEDPKDLSDRAFNILSPMIYPDLYRADGERSQYDMTLPWQDTYSLRQLIDNNSSVMPLLSTGFPFSNYERDLSAEMLRYHVLEAIAGGAKGFGFWGEGIHDALDIAVIGRLVDRLVPAEQVIQHGTPFVSNPVSGVAFVKGVSAPEGALILVSEYSNNPYEVEVKSPIAGTVIDIESGEEIATLSASNPTFSVSLNQRRAEMFYVKLAI